MLPNDYTTNYSILHQPTHFKTSCCLQQQLLQTGGDNNIAQAYSVMLTLFILAIVLIRNHFERRNRTND